MADITPGNLVGVADEPNLAIYNEIHTAALNKIEENYKGTLVGSPNVNYLQVFVEVGRPTVKDGFPQENEQNLSFQRLAQMMDDAFVAAGWTSATAQVKDIKQKANSMIVHYYIELIV